MKDMFIWNTINSRSYGISKVAMKLAEERGIVPYEALCLGLNNFDPTPRTFEGIDRYFVTTKEIEQTLITSYQVPKEKIIVLGIKEKEISSKTDADVEALSRQTLEGHFIEKI